jgi:hypothetical protein
MPDETPVVEKTTQTAGVTETTKATTEASAAAVISLPAPTVADDAIRRKVAGAVIASDTITCVLVLVLLFRYGGTLSKDVLAIAATIIGSIVGYRAGRSSAISSGRPADQPRRELF